MLLTLHNAEEAIAFRRMWSRIPALLPGPFAVLESQLPYGVMFGALLVLSILAFLLTAVVVARPAARSALWVLLAFEAAMAINVLAHVTSAIVVFKGYGPGLVTALLLNAPFAWYALRRARDEEWVSRRAWHGLAFGGAVLHGPVLLGALWVAARFAA